MYCLKSLILFSWEAFALVNIVYRTFTAEDCRKALDFWANAPGVQLHKNGEDTVEGLTAYLKRNPGCSFIAEREGEMVGAILCGHDGRRGIIHHLAVDTRYRRLGIGKKLMRLSLEQLKAEGIKKSLLFVLKENDLGEAFYRSLFWKEEGSVKIYAKVI